jgi:hypothetical protein
MKRIHPTPLVRHHKSEVTGEDEPRVGYEIGTGKASSGKELGEPYVEKKMQFIKICTDDSKDNSSEGLNIMLEIDTGKVFNEIDDDKTEEFTDQDPQRNEGEIITMKLRELDYCDADGNKQKILVFASEPYDVD